MFLQKIAAVIDNNDDKLEEVESPVRLPKISRKKNDSLSRLLRPLRKPGHHCCAKRGCLCQAPDPYPVAPGSQFDSLPSLASAVSVSATSSLFEARYTKQPLSWTKLQQKLSNEPALGTLLGYAAKNPVQDFLLKNPCSFSEVIESDVEAEEDEEDGREEDSRTVPANVAVVVQEQAPEPSSSVPPLVSREKSIDAKMPPLANEDEAAAKRERRQARAAAKKQQQLSEPLSSEDLTFSSYKEIAKKRIRRMQERKRQQQAQGNFVQKKYKALPTFEKELYETAFKRFDTAGLGRLDSGDAIECLREIGLAGSNTSEKRELMQICQDASTVAKVYQNHLMFARHNSMKCRRAGNNLSDSRAQMLRTKETVVPRRVRESQGDSSGSEDFDGGATSRTKADDLVKIAESTIDLYTFAIMVVGNARQKLADMQSNAILRYFERFDRDETGEVFPAACLEASTCLGLDQISLVNALESYGFGRDDKNRRVDFHTFQKCVTRCREERERRVRQWEWQIKDDNGLSLDIFKGLRDIISLAYEIFNSLSEAGTELSDIITVKKAMFALRGLGCLPAGPEDRAYVAEELISRPEFVDEEEEEAQQTLDEPDELNFEDFLMFVQNVHLHWRQQNQDALWDQFRSLDTDHSGSLSMEELSTLLEDLDFMPRNRKEQEELALVIASVDNDGNGTLDFEEFLALLHRIETKLTGMRFEAELQHAIVSGFSIGEMIDFRESFDILDADGSGTLEANELRNCLHILKKPLSKGEFEQVFQNLGSDNNGFISFIQFIDFMSLLRENEGNPIEVASRLPRDVAKLDYNIIRWSLERLNIPRSYLLALDRQGLIALFCEMFGLSEGDNLLQKLQVKTNAQLLELATAKAEATFERLQVGRGGLR